MALIFNGTSSKGVFTGNLAAGGFPYAIFAWIKSASANVEGMVAGFASGQGTFDEVAIYSHGGTGKLRGYVKGPGAVSQPSSTTSQSTSWQPVMVVATATGTTIYYAGGAKVTDSTAVSINASLPNTFTVGVWPETGNSLFYNGEIAELALWRGTVPDDTDWASLAAGATPDSIKNASQVDCWPMTTQGATQVGLKGNVLTMTSTSQASTHPITRTASSSFTGTLQLLDDTAASNFATGATSGFAGNVQLSDDTAASSFGAVAGTFTSEPLKTNNGTLLALTSLSYFALYNDTTGVLVTRRTGLSTSNLGIVSFSDPAIAPGQFYRADWETAAGQRRMPRKAAS